MAIDWNFSVYKPNRVTHKQLVEAMCHLSKITGKGFELQEYTDGKVQLRTVVDGHRGRAISDVMTKAQMYYYITGLANAFFASK